MPWNGVVNIGSRSFTCGFCGNVVASVNGFFESGGKGRKIYICPHCEGATTFDANDQIPGIAPGGEVAHCPDEVVSLYREARNCVAVVANTGAVLCARKLLMNIAVSQGAEAGQSFLSYIDYLADNGFVPPNGRGWVDHIRLKGNEATHEIIEVTRNDAEDLILFAEMLLKFIYEFPNRIPTNTVDDT